MRSERRGLHSHLTYEPVNNGEYKAQMDDAPQVYERPLTSVEPVGCIYEKPIQLQEFIGNLVALIPPPRTHLVRWGGGVFAPHSPFRRDIVLRQDKKKGFQFGDETEPEDEKRTKVPNYSWAKMLAKVCKIDVTKCASCGGNLVKVAAITDLMAARRYLKHVGLPYDAPARAPPRSVQGEFELELFPDNLLDYHHPEYCDE